MEKQHFEILLESMELNIKMMHEGFAGLSDTIKAESAERKAENKLLDEKISALSNRIGSVETNLSNRMDGIDGRLDDIHSELIDHRNNSEMNKSVSQT